MADTIIVQQRWPRTLAARVRRLAVQRHTTVSELTRRAVIDHYSLSEIDGNPAQSDASSTESGEIDAP